MPSAKPSAVEDDRIVACIAMIGATGASQSEVRYSDDNDPVIWMGISKHGEHYSVAAGMTPLEAIFRLTELLIDGGECTGCHLPTGISDKWDGSEMLLEGQVCWWKYDAAEKTFLRGCDGKHAGRQPS